MNLHQLEYLLAIDTHRHFERAAKDCHVTQPTLSMMIRKLEQELDVVLFDRSKHPTIPTPIGVKLINQARVILEEVTKFREIGLEAKNVLSGELNLGVIPTLAPYLIPRFLKPFLDAYPNIFLRIYENTTTNLIDLLKKGQIDAALLVTPLNDKSIIEHPLFYEEFFVYSTSSFNKRYLFPKDINPEELWLLEEGHCFRSQILNLCELQKASNARMEYYAGSLETLIQIVRQHKGTTILPELSTYNLLPEDLKKLVRFAPPAPIREVSMVQHRNQLKKRLIDPLLKILLQNIPEELKLGVADRQIISIQEPR
ncbi:MAG: hydrogen peroxide-inducible genes activator [Saprospiraceae bacterium]|nr:hydrogen peroxide-inducible genes activator [Saprospiraceae bacterium]